MWTARIFRRKILAASACHSEHFSLVILSLSEESLGYAGTVILSASEESLGYAGTVILSASEESLG